MTWLTSDRKQIGSLVGSTTSNQQSVNIPGYSKTDIDPGLLMRKGRESEAPRNKLQGITERRFEDSWETERDPVSCYREYSSPVRL